MAVPLNKQILKNTWVQPLWDAAEGRLGGLEMIS